MTRRSRPRAYLLLARVSNLPTVWTNMLAGSLLAGVALNARTVLIASAAMSLVYCAGMWMNDACDAGADARARRMLLQADRPVAAQLADYAESCMHEGQAKRAVDQKRAHVLDFVRFAGVGRLAEIDRDALQSWLQSVRREGRSNRTVNHHRQSVAAFLSWCVEGGRMRDNPAGLVKKHGGSRVGSDPISRACAA